MALFSVSKGAFRISQTLLLPIEYRISPIAMLQDFKPPPTYADVEFPPVENRGEGVALVPNKLKIMAKIPPPPPNMKPPKMNRGHEYMRGPEEVHNTLIHKQFGIIALQGGRLKHGHFEMIRNTINRKLDTKRMFAIWRVDPPWFSVTKKSIGTRMGGGKGNINHYVTPIKTGRVIIEVGGKLNYEEIRRVMEDVAAKMPVKCIATTYSQMQEEKMKEERDAIANLNPFTFKYVLQNNMGGVNKWASPWDYIWFGKYR